MERCGLQIIKEMHRLFLGQSVRFLFYREKRNKIFNLFNLNLIISFFLKR